jgi:hypothetical protein
MKTAAKAPHSHYFVLAQPTRNSEDVTSPLHTSSPRLRDIKRRGGTHRRRDHSQSPANSGGRTLGRARTESRAELRTLTFDPLPDRARGKRAARPFRIRRSNRIASRDSGAREITGCRGHPCRGGEEPAHGSFRLPCLTTVVIPLWHNIHNDCLTDSHQPTHPDTRALTAFLHSRAPRTRRWRRMSTLSQS